MEIVFTLVEFAKNEYRTYDRLGVASGFLSELKAGEEFYFLKRKFQNFTFPAENKQPLVMIGPGTGIAPFVSFLRSQKAHKQTASEQDPQMWLFYGCRDPFKDFLFKTQMLTVFPEYLTKLSLSYSRLNLEGLTDTGKKDEALSAKFYVTNSRYVQDSIRHYAKEIVTLLNEKNGAVYLCGDAANMSKDVYKCFTDCLSTELSMTLEEANKYMANLVKNKRYKQDIWA